MRKNLIGAVSGLILAFAASSSANAALIWSDEFSRSNSNTVGNGWSETENDSNDVAIVFDNYLLLRDKSPDAMAIQSGISTFGYENITVEFRWRPWDAESNDYLSFVYQAQPDLDWTLGYVSNLGGSESYRTVTVALNLAANNTETLDIGFILDATYKTDAAKIDYVRIYGDELIGGGGGTAVPEASAVALFGLGLLGLGSVARKRRG